jgi:tRNA(fMet)-specific endonuclease VapC
MIYLLDTNACIQLWQRQNLNIRRRIMQHAPSEIALCSVVKAELLFGALRSQQQENNLARLQKLFAPLQSFEFDNLAAEHYAEIRAELTVKGQLIGANDLLIAAIARAHKVTLVTHNTSEFSRVSGLLIEDWEI